MKFDIKNGNLAAAGRRRIEWAARFMKVLELIRREFRKGKPLRGINVCACLHVTTETANLMLTLKEGGARVRLCASNPLSTQDDVAASLVRDFGIEVFAVHGENPARYYAHINAVLDQRPRVTMDDGADLISTIHKKRRGLAADVFGGTEETTTGVIRLRSLERKGLLLFPVIAVNDASTKHLFDNRYGTGQSTIDGILRATNLLLAGSTFVVSGYGWCGRGVAARARGMGAHVVISEVDPLKALEAVMDGFPVMPMAEACRRGDVFVTTTGNTTVIGRRHFGLMRDGAIVANAGHFNVEIDIEALKRGSVRRRQMKPMVEEFTRKGGKKIYLLGEGRLVNLACAEGHPAQVMDMSFANQALSCLHVVRQGRKLEKKVYTVPAEIDRRVAALKLKSLGIKIDRLTTGQKKYLTSWEEGT